MKKFVCLLSMLLFFGGMVMNTIAQIPPVTTDAKIPQIPNGKLFIFPKTQNPNATPLTAQEIAQIQSRGEAAFKTRQAQCAHPTDGLVCFGPTQFQFNGRIYIVIMRGGK